MELRFRLAILVGKLAISVLRLVGRAASSFPGKVARHLCPGLLARLAGQCPEGCVLVTGTNGKTTTAKMISDILTRRGLRVVHNRSGANLIAGITTAFVAAADWRGRLHADIGLIEADEATVPLVAQEAPLAVAVVTNFFRDQLDRFGELDTAVNLVRTGLAALPVTAVAALNADDPLVASLGDAGPRPVFYGLDDEAHAQPEAPGTSDVRHCLACGSAYAYTAHFYSHLGKYRCPQCHVDRPEPAVRISDLTLSGAVGATFTIVSAEGRLPIALSVPGLYNVYNALAAGAACLAMGVDGRHVAGALTDFASSFGRMERLTAGGRRILMALVKNPAGFNEVIRTILSDTDEKGLLIAINDRYADGEDVSWLWDVDFERLAGADGKAACVTVSGIRAEDMALRLKYAGFDVAKLHLEKNLAKAFDGALARVPSGGLLYILPTYTAMLSLRETMHRRRLVQRYWEV